MTRPHPAVPPRPARARVFTLRRRLGRVLAAAATLLLLIVAGAVGVLVDVVRQQDDVTEKYFDAITGADSAYLNLIDAETAVRGYALTGLEVTLEPYERASAQSEGFAAQASRFRDVDGTDRRLRELMERADAAATRWYVEFAQPAIETVRIHGKDSLDVQFVDEGRRIFDDVRAMVEDYLAELRAERVVAVEDLGQGTRYLFLAVLVLALSALLMGVGLWMALRRWITEPLTSLGAAVRRVSTGERDAPVEAVGPQEIARLAADVDQMRRELVGQLAQIESSRAELVGAHQQLSEQAEDLRRSNRDLEQFAYVASHDLQEPLRKVASFTQLLQKRYGGSLDERADQYIDFAVDGAKRMQRLIQDLLGFSRVGRIGGQIEPVDLEDCLRTAVDNLSELIDETGGEVVSEGLPTVSGEHALLVQLLQNLLGNAVKFRDPARPPRVHLSAERVEDGWRLECRDNGIGIDPRYAERVFVIFQRLHPKEAYGGTGIGLALCKKIVEYHGGEIWIGAPEDDRPGAVVCWTLPDTPRAELASRSPGQATGDVTQSEEKPS